MSGAESLRALSADEAAHFSWTDDPPVRKIVAALEAAAPGSARFVGGCVRDSLIGERPKDFDIATRLRPDDVIAALRRAGLGAAPTGIEHGTVTGIADHVGVEVTTLRADVSTDGRRATVAFTDDWAKDAERRDFRLNAIYLTTERLLYDPVGGVADAKAGRVRFIGAPEDRIGEDYLRILRFFRFSARFSPVLDAQGLAAATALKYGLKRLSAERLGEELSRILALPRAAPAVAAMAAAGILAEIWRAPARLDVFAALKKLDSSAPAPLGLAALWDAAEGIDAALRLSNADAARRKRALSGARCLHAALSEQEARAAYYKIGVAAWRDALLLARAQKPAGDWTRLDGLAARWTPPAFPYTGKDVIAAGVERGPAVSRVLKAVEEAWIAEEFPDLARLDAILRIKVAGEFG
ncbi:MAG: CCA tRNA nucleotidyltransferase, partial [Amphiplicatus sp.]